MPVSRAYGLQHPGSKPAQRPRSAGAKAAQAPKEGEVGSRGGSSAKTAPASRSHWPPTYQSPPGSQPPSRTVSPSPDGHRGYGTALPQKAPRAGISSCTVCRLEPLNFRECPSCAARYCASGCLQSWYEHTKPTRPPPMQVPVVATDNDHLVVQRPLDDVEEDESGASDELELALTRIAGGFVIADDTRAEGRERTRWGITSVDGWVLGQPGPGSEWAPAKGVKLTLETLGQCRSCNSHLAVPEYICNSSSRPRSSSRRGGSAVQKPRVKMVEASTQTEVELKNSGVQCQAQTSEEAVQATLPPGAAICRAQVAIAGAALAALASPADPVASSVAGVADGAQDAAPAAAAPSLVLTAEPEAARSCVRVALAAISRVIGGSGAGMKPGTARPTLLSAAVNAVKQVAEASPESVEIQPSSQRILGHRCRAAVPSFQPGEDGNLDAHFEATGSGVLAHGALCALQRASASSSSGPDTRGCSSWLGDAAEEKDVAEAILIEAAMASGAPGAGAGDEFEAPILDAVANLAAFLCSIGGDPAAVGEAVVALATVSQLLPPASATSGARLSPAWRRIASADAWPSADADAASGEPPPGWPLLSAALGALLALSAEDAGGREGEAAEATANRAIQAVAKLGLFLDAQEQAAEDAVEAARAAKEAAEKEEEERKARDAQAAAAALTPDQAAAAAGYADPAAAGMLGAQAMQPQAMGMGMGMGMAPFNGMATMTPMAGMAPLGDPAAMGMPMAPMGGMAGMGSTGFAAPPADDGNSMAAMIDAALGRGSMAPLAPPTFGGGTSRMSGQGMGLGGLNSGAPLAPPVFGREAKRQSAPMGGFGAGMGDGQSGAGATGSGLGDAGANALGAGALGAASTGGLGNGGMGGGGFGGTGGGGFSGLGGGGFEAGGLGGGGFGGGFSDAALGGGGLGGLGGGGFGGAGLGGGGLGSGGMAGGGLGGGGLGGGGAPPMDAKSLQAAAADLFKPKKKR